MADVALEGAGFWLPAEFFADDDVDVLKDQEMLEKPETGSDFCFPTEFPYDLHSGNREHVEKAASWVMSTSPQSTLANWSGIGSPKSAPPPSAPVEGGNHAVVDIICKAAGQVAKLKLTSGDGLRPERDLGLVGPPRGPDQIYSSTRNLSPTVFQHTRAPPPLTVKQENPGGGMWYGPQKQVHDYRSGKAVGRVLDQAAWPVKQNSAQTIGSGNRVFLIGGGVAAAKRECTGTGVFLPRVYGSSKENSCNAFSTESHRKPVYPTSLLQERNVNPLLENFENMKATLVQSLPRHQPETHFRGGFVSDYGIISLAYASHHKMFACLCRESFRADLLMARRNLIMQYQKSLLSEKWAIGRESYHPRG
ncbi:hypothetical protein F511_24598 [Dorcoceras hygrometricum]|uniref:Uncharacterized protein n=1 Tax=Dorcoceras hygrometricum TaxID=472368 RepID=A0A2Z7CY66_9LAMI|nr:hypothetical protein F511_24598 [Dorcoceras hygrometricum]